MISNNLPKENEKNSYVEQWFDAMINSYSKILNGECNQPCENYCGRNSDNSYKTFNDIYPGELFTITCIKDIDDRTRYENLVRGIDSAINFLINKVDYISNAEIGEEVRNKFPNSHQYYYKFHRNQFNKLIEIRNTAVDRLLNLMTDKYSENYSED